MTFASERDFENHLRSIISEIPDVYALESTTIGDIVISRGGTSPAIFFLEVKYFRSSNARLGIGNGSGGGIQPEILEKGPEYLETHLRWAFANDSHNGYWLATSEVVRKFLSGGGIGRKQNNIQPRLFDEHPSVDQTRLVQELKRWLLA